jgi:cystathionine beta-lyase/cystathionine gamma-synthase
MRPDSRAVHAGREPRAREPLAPPIVQASVYVYEDLEDYDAVAAGRAPGHVYGRYSNENVAALERAVADLEGAEEGMAAASGMAAIFSTLLGLCPRPGRIAVASTAYGSTLGLLHGDLEPLGYEIREVDIGDLGAVERAVDGAALLLCETISNPLCQVPDLEAVARLGRQAGAAVVVDNTFASPILCRPLELGATAAVHSATKYIGGHSDLLAGVLAGPHEIVDAARSVMTRTGGSLGPFEAWLALRGLRTLHLRMARHSEAGLRLARALREIPAVGAVHHPLLGGAPGLQVAARVLPHGSGGMFAFDLLGGRPSVQEMLSRLRLVRFAASLAGVETTISYPEITSHRSLSPEERLARGITPGTVRVSAGLEDPEDLVEDFRQALAER